MTMTMQSITSRSFHVANIGWKKDRLVACLQKDPAPRRVVFLELNSPGSCITPARSRAWTARPRYSRASPGRRAGPTPLTSGLEL